MAVGERPSADVLRREALNNEMERHRRIVALICEPGFIEGTLTALEEERQGLTIPWEKILQKYGHPSDG